MRKALLFSLLVLTCAGCSNNSGSPTAIASPTPAATRDSESEEEFLILNGQQAELVNDAREAVNDFVKTRLPGWTVKGLSSELPGNRRRYVLVDADLQREGHSIVIAFEVRKFFPESGESYWLAIPMGKFRADRLHALTELDLQKQLKEAQSELEEATSSPDEQ